MQPSITPDVSITERLDRLDDETMPDAESTFINHGDDILDAVIGLQQMIRNKRLFGCPPLPVGAWNGDAIAIGSGPSLMDRMDDLRQAQDRMLLVAAHSAVPILLKHGVVPHMIAPKERDPDLGIIPAMLPEKVVYAGLPCVPVAPDRCHTAYLVGTNDPMMKWLGFGRQDLGAPTNSGTLSAQVASVVANGAVYLVGYDMTMGHYRGFAYPEETSDGTITCADGEKRPSCRIYRHAQVELSSIADRKVVVQTNPQGGQITGRLALQASLKWDFPAGYMTHTQPVAQYGKFESQVQRFPSVIEHAIHKLEQANGSAAMSVQALMGDDFELGHALFQSVYLSVSILRRTLNLSPDDTTDMLRDALMNPLRTLRPVAHNMVKELHGHH